SNSQRTTHYVFEPGSFVPLLQATTSGTIRLPRTPVWEGDYDRDQDPLWQDPPEAKAFEQLHYYHCDHLGTPQELSDQHGNLAWQASYKAWGEAKEVISDAAKKAGIHNPFRFQGQYYDHETGLHYNRHRYYDPVIGRFVSKDPIGLAGGLNIYQYAPNAVQWVDPLGLTGMNATISGPNIPGGSVSGLSTAEGGTGITNEAVQKAYDNVPKEIRKDYHGDCAEAEGLSTLGNLVCAKNIEDLKKYTAGAEGRAFRNDKKGKPHPACPSCGHVYGQLGIADGHCKS
ncbi:RHS repeat-associated core domain-containing protein, partial [Andreprevotia lacus DSM 23236]